MTSITQYKVAKVIQGNQSDNLQKMAVHTTSTARV